MSHFSVRLASALAAAALTLTACAGITNTVSGSDAPASTPAQTVESTHSYSEAVVNGFMESCDPDGSKTEYCQCSLDSLSEKYSEKEFLEIGLKADSQDPEALAKIAEVIAPCLPKLATGAESAPATESDERVTSSGYKLPESSDWPLNEVEALLSSCEATSEGKTEYCECSATTLQSKFTYQEFVQKVSEPNGLTEIQDLATSSCPL